MTGYAAHAPIQNQPPQGESDEKNENNNYNR